MLIAQISDTHLSAPGQLTYGHVDTKAALESAAKGFWYDASTRIVHIKCPGSGAASLSITVSGDRSQ